MMESNVLLEAKGIWKRYPFRAHPLAPPQGSIEALCGVDLRINKGECVGLVGESGCGKSTLARMMCGLIPPTQGTIEFKGVPFERLDRKGWRTFRKSVQMIFQDPMASLNPRMTIGAIIEEPLAIHRKASGAKRRTWRDRLLHEVGLDPSLSTRFPQALSGGQRQRVGIARALASDPELIICDEPVSSLDLSVQAQILSLLIRLRIERGLALLFISHDLRVVATLADRILVMHEGRLVEEGVYPALFRQPKNPYTRMLVEMASLEIQ